MSVISYIDYTIPEEKLSINTFIEEVNVNAIPASFKNKQEYSMFIESILKLQDIRIETKRTEAEMVGGLIEKMFQAGDIKAEEIDVIMLAQEPENSHQGNLAKFLQHGYNMHNAFIINVSGNHCANIDMALDLAHSLLKARDDLRNLLIIGANKSKSIDRRVFGTYGVMGDAAGIMLMSKKAGPYDVKLFDSVLISNGMFYNVDLNTDSSLVHCKYYVKCIEDLMEKNALDDSMVEKIIIQNANPLLITQCLAAKGFKNDKVFSDNLSKYGHLDCLDFLVNLKDVLDGQIKNKDRYIMTFGTGYAGTYISSLLSFK